MENTEVIDDGAKTGANPKAHARRTPRQKHGLTGLIKGRSKALIGQLDGRSMAVIQMNAYKADLLASLGGAELLSQQELTIVDLVVRDQFILSQVDTFLMQRGMINKRKRTLFPIAVQRQAITDGILRKLQALGLNRRAKPIATLASLLNASPEPNVEAPRAPSH